MGDDAAAPSAWAWQTDDEEFDSLNIFNVVNKLPGSASLSAI
jgi:hypothetical protein